MPKTPKTSNVRPFVNFAQKLTKFFLVAQNIKPPDIGGSGTEKVILLLFWDTLMESPLSYWIKIAKDWKDSGKIGPAESAPQASGPEDSGAEDYYSKLDFNTDNEEIVTNLPLPPLIKE